MRRRLRPTVRLRLAALYTAAFLMGGAGLLTASYALVRHSLPENSAAARQAVVDKLGAGASDPDDRARDRIIEETRLEVRATTLDHLRDGYVLALALSTLVSATLGWLLAGRALSPLHDIIATARRVSEENLHERIALAGPEDELKELADTFDTMLGRLDAAFESQRSFVANASHELRTPLAIIRTEIDVALQSRRLTIDKLTAMAEIVRSASERSERLLEALLTLARSDRGDLHREPVDLATAARSALDDVASELVALDLRVEAELKPATAIGDRALLERLVSNLVENAARHNVHGGWISITTDTGEGAATLVVANGGAAITPADAARLATPFRRLGDERTRRTPGSGLGLSIVDSVARAHGGRLQLIAPGEGLIATVDLPRTPPRSGARPAASIAETS
jgi:signal transduction histidine kinase